MLIKSQYSARKERDCIPLVAEAQSQGSLIVAVDVDDNIFVTDYNNHHIQKFTQDGTFMKAVGQQRDK